MDALDRGKVEDVYQIGKKQHRGRFPTINGIEKRNGHGAGYSELFNSKPRRARYKQRLDRESQQLEIASYATKSFVPSLGFDLSVANQSFAHRTLGIHGSCSNCLPSAKSKFINVDQTGAPIRDILVLPRYSTSGILQLLCPTFVWTITTPLISPLIDPRGPTKTSNRVNIAIQESAVAAASENNQDLYLAKQLQRKRAHHIITTISSSVYKWLLRTSNYTLHWVFWKLFRQLHIQGSHVDMLLEAQKRNVPIIFLPCHKSHLDYILITFVLINIGIKAPHIAAGDNLNIPLFNWLIRHLGGWFIRRKLDNGHGRDDLYRNCLHEYVEQLLKANQNIEFYIEGSRSRTGKPALPKGGLLSILVEAVREGVVSDILIVPTSITYDRILERNFIRHELLGGSKKPENFLKGLKGVWSMLTKNIGCVRMDFAQPFSLKDYLCTHHISKYSLMDLSHQSVINSPDSKSLSDRRLVHALGYHIVYDFNCCAPVMSTNIVGFLLMTKYRNGVAYSDLVNSYEWMVNRITSWGRVIGYSGPPNEAVHYALIYLNHLLITKKITRNKTEEEFFVPRLELPDVFELLHHMNQVIICFVKDAIIACSIAVLVYPTTDDRDAFTTGDDRDAFMTGDDSDGDPTTLGNTRQSNSQISQTELADQALHFAAIFAREFIYSPPCVDIMTTLFEGIESLKRIEILKDVKRPDSYLYSNRRVNNLWGDTLDDFSDDDDDDEMIEVNHSVESREYLQFLQCVLGPYIEGYWSCAMYIQSIAEKGELYNESQFLYQLQKTLTEKAMEGSLYYIESCSSDILRNALRSYIGIEIISVDEEGKLSIKNKNKLYEIIHTLSVCKL